MHEGGLDHLAPTTYDVTLYTPSLHRALPSPASVANTLSGARAWLWEVGASDAAIRRQDIVPAAGGLWVTIASSKTLKTLPQAPSPARPTAPWRPGSGPSGSTLPPCQHPAPAFLARRGSPSPPVNSPRPSGSPSGAPAFPRRRGTPSTVSAGAPPGPARCRAWSSALVAQGTWQSGAVHAYVPRLAPLEAPRALAICFGSARGASSGACQ